MAAEPRAQKNGLGVASHIRFALPHCICEIHEQRRIAEHHHGHLSMTTELLLHNRRVDSVFNLLGEKENDITFSVGWALSRSPSFLKEFLRSSAVWTRQVGSDTAIRLQTHEPRKGITDIEIESADDFFLIVEAKRAWDLPSKAQLRTYLRRNSFSSSRARRKAIVVLSECTREYAKANLQVPSHPGSPVIPISWKSVYDCCLRARRRSSHTEKRLLHELATYLESIMTMQNKESNWVYVVALGGTDRTPKKWQITFRDLVNEKRRYFHPLGQAGWPSEPPNYIAFRYHGRLQTIHHIESYAVFTNPHKIFREIPTQKWVQHIVYRLGPPISPGREVRTGKIFRNGRVWCMLDTLLTCNTISDARDLSKKRKRE